MSREAPRRWFAIDCAADTSPPLFRLRSAAGPYADVLYYRAVAFCKLYADQGQLEKAWSDLSAFVRWPDSAEELRDLFRATGIATGPRDTLYLWYESNGWIIKAHAADAAKHREMRARNKVRAGRERARRAAMRAADPGLGGRLVGRLVGRDVPPDKNGTSPGRHRDVTGTQKTTNRKDRS